MEKQLNVDQLVENSDLSYQEKCKDHIVILAWANEDKRDNLIISDELPFAEEMASRAKGTTVYELIDACCPSLDPNTVKSTINKVFPEGEGAHYGDYSDVPEFFNGDIIADLTNKINQAIKLKEKLEAERTQKQKEAEETGSNQPEGGNQ